MEVAKEILEGNKVQLKVEVEKKRVNDALDKAFRKIAKEVVIPGFRKGKVPRKVLESRYGKEILHRDAFDFLVPEAYNEAIKIAEIEPIDQPVIEDFFISENEPATFTAVVEVKPVVKLGDYTGLGIEKEKVEVSAEDIENVLKIRQEQHAELVSVEKEVVEKGDFVIIDFTGFINGEKFPGGSAEEYTLEIGSGSFIPGFEEQLVGKKVGEETELKVSFPEDYRAENLAGKEAVFKVNIKELKVKKLPELDDDFAKDVSDFETLEELKEDIKKKLLEQKENRAQVEFENKLIEAVTNNAEVDVPDILIEDELDIMLENMNYNLSLQGINVEQYFQYMGIEKDKWRERTGKLLNRGQKAIWY